MDQSPPARIVIDLPCRISGIRGCRLPLFGRTRDISRGGALIEMAGVNIETVGVRPGDRVTLEIDLPSAPGSEAKCFCCRCTVVRAAPEGEKILVVSVSFSRISVAARRVHEHALLVM